VTLVTGFCLVTQDLVRPGVSGSTHAGIPGEMSVPPDVRQALVADAGVIASPSKRRNATIIPRRHAMPLIVARNRVIICLLFLLSVLPGALISPASAQTTVRTPVLASAVAPPTGLIAVQGQHFTPGGLVYIAVYDRWGVDVHVHLWTIAAGEQFGPNGSMDPAQGYIAAGSLAEVIDLFPATVYGPNGSMDPAQGYSSGRAAAPEPEAIYGPNGSQDPAQGYVPAGEQAEAGVTCGRDLMIRAYDQQAATWSNVVDVVAGC
jgi:hypothetical protein